MSRISSLAKALHVLLDSDGCYYCGKDATAYVRDYTPPASTISVDDIGRTDLYVVNSCRNCYTKLYYHQRGREVFSIEDKKAICNKTRVHYPSMKIMNGYIVPRAMVFVNEEYKLAADTWEEHEVQRSQGLWALCKAKAESMSKYADAVGFSDEVRRTVGL